MKIAKIKLNPSNEGPWLKWEYMVDIYTLDAGEEKLVGRFYTDSILDASLVASAVVPKVQNVTVEV